MTDRKALLFRIAFLIAVLYAFFLGLDLMGLAFKSLGEDFAETLIAKTNNPFIGLFIGILATTLIQSSSTTTSITVGLVAGGGLTVDGAIPIIMGANIGTSVTNTIVSLAHVTRRDEFRRAFSAATVHDFFNWLAVLVLFPLELATHFLGRTAHALEQVLEGTGGLELFNPVKAIVRPVSEGLKELADNSAFLMLACSLLFIFLALRFLVTLLRKLLSARAEAMLHRTLFRSPLHAMAAGALITAMIQSSSVTTSTIVPLVGAGIVTLAQAFPFTLGANIGTTVTPILAGLASQSPAGITVGLSHLLFNLTGTVLVYPWRVIRRVPLFLAEKLGDLGARSRLLAGTYIIAVFYGLPILLLFLSGGFSTAKDREPPAQIERSGEGETPAPEPNQD